QHAEERPGGRVPVRGEVGGAAEAHLGRRAERLRPAPPRRREEPEEFLFLGVLLGRVLGLVAHPHPDGRPRPPQQVGRPPARNAAVSGLSRPNSRAIARRLSMTGPAVSFSCCLSKAVAVSAASDALNAGSMAARYGAASRAGSRAGSSRPKFSAARASSPAA